MVPWFAIALTLHLAPLGVFAAAASDRGDAGRLPEWPTSSLVFRQATPDEEENLARADDPAVVAEPCLGFDRFAIPAPVVAASESPFAVDFIDPPVRRCYDVVVLLEFPDGATWSNAGDDWAALAVVTYVYKDRPALKSGEVRPPWEGDPAVDSDECLDPELRRLLRGRVLDHVIPGE